MNKYETCTGITKYIFLNYPKLITENCFSTKPIYVPCLVNRYALMLFKDQCSQNAYYLKFQTV